MATSIPVTWLDESEDLPAVGSLALEELQGHLVGATAGRARHVHFVADELERVEVVSQPAQRIRGLPTLAVTVHDRGRILIAQMMGFGALTEVLEQLTSWQT